MAGHSIKLTQPFFRHFIPVAEDILVHTPATQVLRPFVIDLSKWLIQGAYPIDPKLISKADNHTAWQFQGGYRCTIEILSQPANGIATISENQLGLAYTPKITYRGPDAFGYRIVNVMGQPSDAYCVTLYVRT
jgi:hypothetical protein